MIKAYKYELRPTELQKQQLNGAFGSCRFLYNLALETKIQSYQRGKSVTCFDLMKQLTGLKKDLIWLSDVPIGSLQHSISNLDNAYTNFFKGRANFPRFKKKSCKQTFKIPSPVTIDFYNHKVRLPKYGWVYFNKDRNFTGDIRYSTVSKNKAGRYFISIVVETGKPFPKSKKVKEQTTIGVDLGLKHFITLSDGRKIEHPRLLRNSLKRLRVEQRSLHRKMRGSKRRSKQVLKLAKVYERVTNQRKDFLHKLSTEITNQYDSIAIENLNITGMIKNTSLSLSIADSGWGEFIRQLKYKARWSGKNILQIGRFEPSSKMCPCGMINSNLNLNHRSWTCINCGATHDRDVLAAKNIKIFGLKSRPSFANVSQ